MPNNNYVRRNFYQGHDPMFIPTVTTTYEETAPTSVACGCECGDPCGCPAPDPGGPTGVTGATGPTGPTGATGPQGTPGTASETGATGPEGPMGERGPTGANGQNGLPGLPGINGAKGEKGDKGDIGPAGQNGITGPTGANGQNGLPGLPGEKGATGVPGPTGATGAAGQNGATGAAGSGGVSDILSVFNIAGGRVNFSRNNALVPFPDTSINTSYLTNDARTVFTVPEDGIYYIEYDIYTTKQVNMQTTIIRDGQPLSGTGNSFSVNDYHFTGTIITPLNINDIISVRMTDTNDSYVLLNDDIGARLTIYKIADISILGSSVVPRNMNMDICVCPC